MTPTSPTKTRKPLHWLILGVWALAVAGGFLGLMLRESVAGAQGNAPTQWPADSEIARDTKLPTLVMFMHPHCACSAASLAEFERTIARSNNASFMLVFVKPEGADADFHNTALWRRASELAGVKVCLDPQAREAMRFGALTSGQCVVYGPGSELRYQGGITGSRGHEGDNDGRTAISHALSGESGTGKGCVYGCGLHNSKEMQ